MRRKRWRRRKEKKRPSNRRRLVSALTAVGHPVGLIHQHPGDLVLLVDAGSSAAWREEERMRDAKEREREKRKEKGKDEERWMLRKKNEGKGEGVALCSLSSWLSLLSLPLLSHSLFSLLASLFEKKERRHQLFFVSRKEQRSPVPVRRHAGGKQRRDDQLQQQQACVDVVGLAKGNDEDDGDGDSRKDAAPEPLAMRPRRCCRCIGFRCVCLPARAL